jgi:hypothetical protein
MRWINISNADDAAATSRKTRPDIKIYRSFKYVARIYNI